MGNGYKTLSARDSNVNTGISQSKCNYRCEILNCTIDDHKNHFQNSHICKFWLQTYDLPIGG